MKPHYSPAEIDALLYSLDWKQIMSQAIEGRPSSWAKRPIVEWRNASDEVSSAVINALRKKIDYDPWKEAMAKVKE